MQPAGGSCNSSEGSCDLPLPAVYPSLPSSDPAIPCRSIILDGILRGVFTVEQWRELRLTVTVVLEGSPEIRATLPRRALPDGLQTTYSTVRSLCREYAEHASYSPVALVEAFVEGRWRFAGVRQADEEKRVIPMKQRWMGPGDLLSPLPLRLLRNFYPARKRRRPTHMLNTPPGHGIPVPFPVVVYAIPVLSFLRSPAIPILDGMSHSTDWRNANPLHHAASQGNVEAALDLLEHCYSNAERRVLLRSCTLNQQTPLEIAVARRKEGFIVRVLEGYGEFLGDELMKALLVECIKAGLVKAAGWILRSGVSVDGPLDPLVVATSKSPEMLRLMADLLDWRAHGAVSQLLRRPGLLDAVLEHCPQAAFRRTDWTHILTRCDEATALRLLRDERVRQEVVRVGAACVNHWVSRSKVVLRTLVEECGVRPTAFTRIHTEFTLTVVASPLAIAIHLGDEAAVRLLTTCAGVTDNGCVLMTFIGVRQTLAFPAVSWAAMLGMRSMVQLLVELGYCPRPDVFLHVSRTCWLVQRQAFSVSGTPVFPGDVWDTIISFLPVEAVCALERTSRGMYNVTIDKLSWEKFLTVEQGRKMLSDVPKLTWRNPKHLLIHLKHLCSRKRRSPRCGCAVPALRSELSTQGPVYGYSSAVIEYGAVAFMETFSWSGKLEPRGRRVDPWSHPLDLAEVILDLLDMAPNPVGLVCHPSHDSCQYTHPLYIVASLYSRGGRVEREQRGHILKKLTDLVSALPANAAPLKHMSVGTFSPLIVGAPPSEFSEQQSAEEALQQQFNKVLRANSYRNNFTCLFDSDTEGPDSPVLPMSQRLAFPPPPQADMVHHSSLLNLAISIDSPQLFHAVWKVIATHPDEDRGMYTGLLAEAISKRSMKLVAEIIREQDPQHLYPLSDTVGVEARELEDHLLEAVIPVFQATERKLWVGQLLDTALRRGEDFALRILDKVRGTGHCVSEIAELAHLLKRHRFAKAIGRDRCPLTLTPSTHIPFLTAFIPEVLREGSVLAVEIDAEELKASSEELLGRDRKCWCHSPYLSLLHSDYPLARLRGGPLVADLLEAVGLVPITSRVKIPDTVSVGRGYVPEWRYSCDVQLGQVGWTAFVLQCRPIEINGGWASGSCVVEMVSRLHGAFYGLDRYCQVLLSKRTSDRLRESSTLAEDLDDIIAKIPNFLGSDSFVRETLETAPFYFIFNTPQEKQGQWHYSLTWAVPPRRGHLEDGPCTVIDIESTCERFYVEETEVSSRRWQESNGFHSVLRIDGRGQNRLGLADKGVLVLPQLTSQPVDVRAVRGALGVPSR